jgi:hypothetical protein
VHVPGLNHLLVPAKTGAVSEYDDLTERTISPRIAEEIASWIRKTL